MHTTSQTRILVLCSISILSILISPAIPIGSQTTLQAQAIPTVQAVSANPDPLAMSWDDAPLPLPYHGLNDWLYETGQRTAQQAYGPLASHKIYKVGDTERFFSLNYDTGESIPITATLRAITTHAYWWFQNGTPVDPTALAQAGDRFEKSIYPLDSQVFSGSSQSHGVDSDPHIFILHQKTIGQQVVGLFRSADECPTEICADSNQHDMLYIGLDNGPVGSSGELDTISHELQHLLRYRAGGQDRWLDEGLAQLAEHLNGYSQDDILGSGVDDFMTAPQVQINDWPTDDSDPSLNYAVGYLFVYYLDQRYGVSLIQAIARSPYKGMAAISHALTAIGVAEPIDRIFADWTVTNLIDDPKLGDGRYFYPSLAVNVTPHTADLSAGRHYQDTLPEYSADYVTLTTPGTYRLTFTGQATDWLSPPNVPGGGWMWWSYNAPEGITRLEHVFDLRQAQSPILNFKAWWSISDPDGDRAYGLISTDNGFTWQPISATGSGDCTVEQYCYNGHSNGWQDEQIDLSQYAGQQIRLRFETATESGGLSDGLFLTDFSLPAIGWADSVQNGPETWQSNGFMRVTDQLPQHWAVNVVPMNGSIAGLPIPMSVTANGTGSLIVTVPADGATVVVGAMTPFLRGKTHYTLAAQAIGGNTVNPTAVPRSTRSPLSTPVGTSSSKKAA